MGLRANLVHLLLSYFLWAKDGLHIFKWLGKKNNKKKIAFDYQVTHLLDEIINKEQKGACWRIV